MASTITRGDSTFILPPQTTPFSLSWNGVASNNPCASASAFCPTAVNQVLPAESVNHLQCTQGFRTTSSLIETQMDECFPDNFFQVFEDKWSENDIEPFPTVLDVLTAAYPGDQCIDGWSTACEAQVTQTWNGDAVTQNQAWCCASGYQCTTHHKSASSFAPPGRICYLSVTTPTEVWASFDPPVETDGSEFYVYTYSLSEAPSSSANMIYHNPLPLALGQDQHASGVPTITIDYTVPAPTPM